MLIQAAYPTREHQAAAAAIVEFFVTAYDIEAVLLVNSCARGRATRDSCLYPTYPLLPVWRLHAAYRLALSSGFSGPEK